MPIPKLASDAWMDGENALRREPAFERFAANAAGLVPASLGVERWLDLCSPGSRRRLDTDG